MHNILKTNDFGFIHKASTQKYTRLVLFRKLAMIPGLFSKWYHPSKIILCTQNP